MLRRNTRERRKALTAPLLGVKAGSNGSYAACMITSLAESHCNGIQHLALHLMPRATPGTLQVLKNLSSLI